MRATKERAGAFACSQCGEGAPRWFGRCPSCGSWGSAIDIAAPVTTSEVVSLDASIEEAERTATGLTEVDRVLGGGLVRGSVALLGGEPGIGKSTLVLQLMDALAARGARTLLATGEESLAQVGLRARRLLADPRRVRAVATSSMHSLLAAWEAERPDVVVVDSIQTLQDEDVDSTAGSTAQVRGCAARLVRQAKSSGASVVIVGHVTKDGSVAGPKTLEHVVDVVVMLEGERSGALRLLRSSKNRFGSCEEIGVLSMTGTGLEAVADPSTALLEERREGAAGSIVFPAVEGSRSLLIEIQALVYKQASARRVCIGLDQRRLAMVLGVLEKHIGLDIAGCDVFVTVSGGLETRDPAADLPLALAISSALTGKPVDQRTVAAGELGLTGEVRSVPAIQRRMGEAARLGFATALVPRRRDDAASSLSLVTVHDVEGALRAAAITP